MSRCTDDTIWIRVIVTGGTAFAAAVYAFPFVLIGSWLMMPV